MVNTVTTNCFCQIIMIRKEQIIPSIWNCMAVEVAVLYAFQAASGQLYEGIGLLVGLFMAGLTLGASLCLPKLLPVK